MLRAGQLAYRKGPHPEELMVQDFNRAVKGMKTRGRNDFKPYCNQGSHLRPPGSECIPAARSVPRLREDEEKKAKQVDQGKTIMHTKKNNNRNRRPPINYRSLRNH